MTLYYAFNGVLWSDEDREDWLSYSVSECDWQSYGEKICEEETERLERLVFSDIKNFRGKMPPEVSFLSPTEISIVHMESQSFALKDLLPMDKETMSRLKKINFSHTRLHGFIPKEIAWMSALEEINFAETSGLEGELPLELGLLHELKLLYVQGNRLSGLLPKQIASLWRLKYAHFQRNALMGHIPDDWCTLISLVQLRLDDNYLEGSIPDCLLSLASLEHFSYGGNQLIAP